jgi:GMP synthase (glutamine-hydrolysing)
VTNQTPLLIVQCTVWEKIFPRLSDVSGDVDAVIRAALSATNCEVVVVRVCEGEMLRDAREFSAVVISGSPVMVGDPDPWIESTMRWVRETHIRQVPTLGICFGHQLIARALGGKVGTTSVSAELNTAVIERMATDAEDRLLSFLPRKFLAQAAHSEIVTEPPLGSRILARNAAGIQALQFGPVTWGVQFHPEFEDRHLWVIQQEHKGPVAPAIEADAKYAAVQRTDEVAKIFERFHRLATNSEVRLSAFHLSV